MHANAHYDLLPMRRHRHRRGYYALSEERGGSRTLRALLLLCALGVVFYLGSKLFVNLTGIGTRIESLAANLTVERGQVNVALEGGSMRRAESELKLYEDDILEVPARSNAILEYFDGTHMRLDEQSRVRLGASKKGTKESSIELTLEQGSAWIATPTMQAFSGAIERVVETGDMSINLPAETEAIITPTSVIVYASDGPGLEIAFSESSDTVIVGEGQIFTVRGEIQSDTNLYAWREPLDPRVLESDFLRASRSIDTNKTLLADNTLQTTPEDILTILRPLEGELIKENTVEVAGTFNASVDRIRVNGYQATIDKENFTFSQQLALPAEDEVEIQIDAIDAKGLVLEKTTRTIARDIQPPPPPVITAPASSGQTLRTQSAEIEIRGTNAANIAGILVNDYRLQLFRKGDTSWSYLASTQLGNFRAGRNVYTIRTIDDAGNQSAPAVITILLEEGVPGIVTDTSQPTSPTSETPIETEIPTNLPDNDPLNPGILSITAPTTGEVYEATTEREILIEGKTGTQTASVWVNGYNLRLYEAGKDFWNYIASTEYGTLNRGTNTYEVIARNADGQILDKLTYTIEFTPGR